MGVSINCVPKIASFPTTILMFEWLGYPSYSYKSQNVILWWKVEGPRTFSETPPHSDERRLSGKHWVSSAHAHSNFAICLAVTWRTSCCRIAAAWKNPNSLGTRNNVKQLRPTKIKHQQQTINQYQLMNLNISQIISTNIKIKHIKNQRHPTTAELLAIETNLQDFACQGLRLI